MKWLLDLLERLRPNFEEGGRLQALKPLFEAAENFHFSPATRTLDFPHVRDPLDVKRFMSMVIIALLPCLFASLYFFGLRILAMIVVSYVVGGVVEVLFAVIRKEEINEGFLVTGLIFPLILPPDLSLPAVAVGVAFAVLVGKELFGGTGRNLFNPALVGRCFLFIGYPTAMSFKRIIEPGSGLLGRLTEYNVEAVTGATPLALAKQGVWDGLSRMDLFFGHVAGSAGETSALAVLIGGIFLILTRVANWRTVVGTLGSFLALELILRAAAELAFGGALPPDHKLNFGPFGFQFLAGGLLFGTFFMATDPVSSPMTNGAKWMYGAFIGVVALLIRRLTGYPEGAMFAILLGNICAPVLDEIVIRFRLRRLQHEG